jgi:ribosomal protein L14
MTSLLEYIKSRGCVTTDDVAAAFGVSKSTAWQRLRRLEKLGTVNVWRFGWVMWWCVDGAVPDLSKRKRRSTMQKVVERVDAVAKILGERGCVPTSTLMRELGVSHSNVLYALQLLQSQGRAVERVIGKTAIWCKDEATADGFISRIKEAVHRLVTENKMRYATPKKVLKAALVDKEAYKLLSAFIPLSRMDRFHPVALAFIDDVLYMLYGEPLRYTNSKNVYIVQPGGRVETTPQQVRERCCQDLRRYLEKTLASARGGVVSVVVSRVVPDKSMRRRYAICISRALNQYKRKYGVYIMTKEEAAEVLKNFDALCATKPEVGRKPRQIQHVNRMILVSFHIPPTLLQILDDYAAELNTTRSAVVRMAISQMLEKMWEAAEKQATLLAAP